MNDEATPEVAEMAIERIRGTRSTESTWDVFMADPETTSHILIADGVRIEGIHSNEDRAKEAIRLATAGFQENERYGTFRVYRTDNDQPHEITRAPKVIPEHVQDQWS